MQFHTFAIAGVFLAATAIAGCGTPSGVEIRGSTGNGADVGGPISVLVVDAQAFDDGGQFTVIATVAQQHQPGAFAVTVDTDAETLEVFAIRDNDENRSCSDMDDTAHVRVVIGDADRVDVPELDVSSDSSPGAGLALPVYCPAYAARF